MRPQFLMLLLFVLAYANSIAQTTYVVDQNTNAPTGDHVFNDLQTCIDNASNGDMIHIIPAVDHYGDVLLDKELHLVGAGWVPDNQSGMISKVNSISFSANESNGSTLNGLVITKTSDYPVTFGELNAPLDTLKNIEIYNCKIPGILQRDNCPLKNVTLRNNIFATLYSTTGYPSILFSVVDGFTSNLLITNNIINVNYANGNIRAGISAANQTVITNNMFCSRQAFYIFFDIKNSFITNNVFYGASAYSFKYGSTEGVNYNNVYSNNLSYACELYNRCDIPPPSTHNPPNTGGGNLVNTDPLLEYIEDSWIWDVKYSLTLLEYSPLEDAGTDGTDIGVTGGRYPFNNYSHLRGVPYVHSLSVPGLIMTNQPIQLDGEARTDQ